MKTEANEPINPITSGSSNWMLKRSDLQSDNVNGLTKREYFAAMAMQGILAAGYIAHEGETSKTAVIHADALIKALNQ